MSHMMKTLFVSMTLLLFVGCGEGFRAQGNQLQSNGGDAEFYNNQGSGGFNTPDLDKEILLTYETDLNGHEFQTQNLTRNIGAFDMVLTSDGNQNFNLKARIAVSCNEYYEINRVINQNIMTSRQRVDLGSGGPFDVEVRCTTGSCQKLVAAIHKVSGANQGTVLVGLTVGGQQQGQILFVSRSVNYQPYFASFINVQTYQQTRSCTLSNGNQQPTSIKEALTDAAKEAATEALQNWVDDTLERIF